MTGQRPHVLRAMVVVVALLVTPTRRASADVRPASELFTGEAVTMPAPATKVSIGMTEAEAKAAAPEELETLSGYGYKVPGYVPAVSVQPRIGNGKVVAIRVDIGASQEAVKGWLTAAWGPPLEKSFAGNQKQYIWESPSTGLQAMLRRNRSASLIMFWRVISIDKVLGNDSKRFAIEAIPLIGATRDAAMKALHAYRPLLGDVSNEDRSLLYFKTPAIAGADSGVAALALRIKNDKVTGYELSVPEVFARQLEARLIARFGPGTVEENGDTIHAGPPRVVRRGTRIYVGDFAR